MELSRFKNVASKTRVNKSFHLFRNQVPGYGNDAMSAVSHQSKSDGIITGHNAEMGEIFKEGINNIANMIDAVGDFLHTYYIRDFCQTPHCRDRHRIAAAAGMVV